MEPTSELTQVARKWILTDNTTDRGYSWLINLTNSTRDYDLNTVCHDICFKETFECIMSCDPTDSDCVYRCIRAEAPCLESKLSNFFLISYQNYLSYNKNVIKAVHVISTVPMDATAAKILFANARSVHKQFS